MRKPKLINKRAFDKMDVHTQRVSLLKDALLRLRFKLMAAEAGTWINTTNLTTNEHGAYVNAAQVQKNINNPEESCEVCARGAILATWIGNFDSVSGAALERMDGDGVKAGFPRQLRGVFSDRLLSAMESGFECYGRVIDRHTGHITQDESIHLADAFNGNDHERLEEIYRNVIKNKGTLVIEIDFCKVVFD